MQVVEPQLAASDALDRVGAKKLSQRQRDFARKFASAAKCRTRADIGVADDLKRPFPGEE